MIKNMNSDRLCLLLLLSLSVLWTPIARAQTVHYKTRTEVKIHALGGLNKLMGNKPTQTEYFIDAQHVRTDEDDRMSTIFSVPESKFVTMDHKKKTFFEMTFEDMASMFTAAKEDVQQKMDESNYDPDDLEFSINVEDLGESAEVAGFSADRKLMTVEVKFTAEATDDEGNVETASGKFYAVSDMWIGKDVPGYEVFRDFGSNYASKMGEEFESTNAGFGAMQQAFMTDGRMKPAMEKLAEEMKKMDGTPLRTVSYIVLGPEDGELDVDAIIGAGKQAEPEKKKGGLGRFARNALKGSGINIGGGNEPEEKKEPAEQLILTETETVYLLFETVQDDPGRFTVPANYEQVDAPSYFEPKGGK